MKKEIKFEFKDEKTMPDTGYDLVITLRDEEGFTESQEKAALMVLDFVRYFVAVASLNGNFLLHAGLCLVKAKEECVKVVEDMDGAMKFKKLMDG